MKKYHYNICAKAIVFGGLLGVFVFISLFFKLNRELMVFLLAFTMGAVGYALIKTIISLKMRIGMMEKYLLSMVSKVLQDDLETLNH